MSSIEDLSFSIEQTPPTASPSVEDVQFLEDHIDEFNMSFTGVRDARLLSIILRDGEKHRRGSSRLDVGRLS